MSNYQDCIITDGTNTLQFKFYSLYATNLISGYSISRCYIIYNIRLEIMLKSTIILILIKWIDGQEMLKNPRCNQYPNRGRCEDRGFTIKWYYDRYAHRCREFYYGGCDANDNHFDSFEGMSFPICN